MCLSIPSQVVALHPEENCVTVDTLGVRRKVSCMLLDTPLNEGEFVLLHIGFVMSRLDPQEALESLAYYRQIQASSGELPC